MLFDNQVSILVSEVYHLDGEIIRLWIDRDELQIVEIELDLQIIVIERLDDVPEFESLFL